jgi:hypothetical protein
VRPTRSNIINAKQRPRRRASQLGGERHGRIREADARPVASPADIQPVNRYSNAGSERQHGFPRLSLVNLEDKIDFGRGRKSSLWGERTDESDARRA